MLRGRAAERQGQPQNSRATAGGSQPAPHVHGHSKSKANTQSVQCNLLGYLAAHAQEAAQAAGPATAGKQAVNGQPQPAMAIPGTTRSECCGRVFNSKHAMPYDAMPCRALSRHSFKA